MADIDMIPRSYRDGLRVRRVLATYGAALGLLLVVGGGAAATLRWRLAVEKPRVAALQASSTEAEALRQQVIAAQARKTALEGSGQALAGVRGAGAIGTLSRAVDASLNDKVWFTQLTFSRTQEALRDAAPSPLPPGTVQTYAPSAPGAAFAVQSWRLASHVEITAQAQDSAAMTAFLAALSASPALAGVRFINSGAASEEGGSGLTFRVAGSLRPQGGAK